jgi:membrane protein YqaA with SNARE-associated domain
MSIHGIIDSFTDSLLEYGGWGLAFISFIESSFFPIPPDVLLIPLALMDPENVWWLALITTCASTLGAILGMWIGRKLGRPVLLRFVTHDRVDWIQDTFRRFGGWAIFIAAFTPIPYKVFTIAAGVFHANVWTVLFASFLGRGARFFSIAAVIYWIGVQAVDWIGSYLGPLSFAIAALVLLAGYIYYLIQYRRNRK